MASESKLDKEVSKLFVTCPGIASFVEMVSPFRNLLNDYMFLTWLPIMVLATFPSLFPRSASLSFSLSPSLSQSLNQQKSMEIDLLRTAKLLLIKNGEVWDLLDAWKYVFLVAMNKVASDDLHLNNFTNKWGASAVAEWSKTLKNERENKRKPKDNKFMGNQRVTR